MKLLIYSLLIVLWSNMIMAQRVGKVVDIETKKPIPYVNMQVLGTRIGYTTDYDGKYKIGIESNETIIISAIGYETKTLTIDLIKDDVFLKPISYEIPEITIHNEDKTIEIGRVKKQIISYYYGADNSFAYMIGRFFNFEDEYKEAPLLKSIEILTDSDIENAQFNIRLYKVDSTGQPDQPIHNMNIFGFAAKGTNKTKIDLEKLYLQFPEDKLFVAIEWLQIDQNMFEWSYKSNESQKTVKMISLEPSFAVENDQKKGNGWTYDGKWRSKSDLRLLHMKIILRN